MPLITIEFSEFRNFMQRVHNDRVTYAAQGADVMAKSRDMGLWNAVGIAYAIGYERALKDAREQYRQERERKQ